MKIIKSLGVLTAACLSFALSPASNAIVIYTIEAAGIVSTQVGGATTIDFEGLGTHNGTTINCPYISCTGNYEFRDNDGHVHNSAAPYTATPLNGDWLTVPNDLSSGSATFVLGNNYNYFGLFWGSVDTYNTLQFFNGATQVGGNITGSTFIPALNANGNQGSWNSNRFINFFFTSGDTYNTVKLTSTNFAFETDNHAFANVPEPTPLALLGLGLAGLGFSRRKKI